MEPDDAASVLDSAEAITARDPSRLLWSLATAGAQVRRALAADTEARAGGDRADAGDGLPRALLVTTDAFGSAGAGVLSALAGTRVPVVPWAGAELPRWAGPADALLAASVDGRHPRVAALVDDAARRGLLGVTIAPADSPVAAAAGRSPVVEVAEPVARRAGLWSLLTPLLLATDRLGLTKTPAAVLEAVADALDQTAGTCRAGGDAFTNPAKQLASELIDADAVLAGVGPLACVAVRAMADALALLAGCPAFAVCLPDDIAMAGCLIVGAHPRGPDDIFRDRVDDLLRRPRLIVVGDDGDGRDPDEADSSGRTNRGEGGAHRAARALYDVAEAAGVRASGVDVPAGAPIVRFAAATAFGDFTAAYLAVARGIDPGAPRAGELPH